MPPFRVLRFLILAFVGSSLANAATQEVYPLTKLLLADTEQKVLALPRDAGGPVPVFVQDLDLYADAEFSSKVAQLIGRPIGDDLLNEFIRLINEHAQKKDRLIAKVLIPTQDVTAGTLRFAVRLGRYNDFLFQGNRWFSKKLLEEKLGLKAGDEVRLSTLEEAVNWTNTNPFREVKVLIEEVPQEPGKANLVVAVRERAPLRAMLSVDNTGNQVIGENRYAFALQHGNMWGRDHFATYQFLTADDVKVFQAHVVDYRIPLRWRHFLQFSGNFVRTNPTFADGLLMQTGKNVSANVRYTVPLQTGQEPRDVYFGFSYKHGNNNLEFDPQLTRVPVFATSTDTFQLFAGFSAVNRDKRGGWMFGATVFASPGNINSRNTDEAHQAYGSRLGASASYVYGTLSIQRLLHLGKSGWDLVPRLTLQAASDNIVQGEHLGIGGANTVRGFDEYIYAAEQGFVFNTDVLSPVWKVRLPFLGKNGPPLETRFLAFYDAAQVEYKHRYPADIPFAPLASAGVGLRASVANNVTVSFDYGWQLSNLPLPPRTKSRGHIKVMLAY